MENKGKIIEAGDQCSQTVLLNTFVIKKKRCRVYFHQGTLIWETERPPYSKFIILNFIYIYGVYYKCDNREERM